MSASSSRRIGIALLLLSSFGGATQGSAQADLVRYKTLFDNRWTLSDVADEAKSLAVLQPQLRDSIAAPDELEMAFAPWTFMDSLENVMVQWLLSDGMQNFQKMAWLYDGFCLPIRARLETEDLPVSFACLPLMLTAGDPSYVGPGDRAGIWALPQVAEERSQTCDERHHVDRATDAAIASLMDWSRVYPDDALQVVWSFMRAGSPEAWQPHPEPKASKAFDEWLTLFRVLVRFLENFEREDHRGVWLLQWADAEEVVCPGPLNRTTLREELHWNRRQQQTWMPWWRGHALTCAEWDDCPVVLPRRQAAAWNEAFADGIQSADAVDFPETLHRVSAGESLGGIARLYGVRLAEIVSTNDLASEGLQVDQTLRIPALQ
jgi:hypothetical protein